MQYVVRAVLCFGQARLLGNTRGSSLFCTADVHMYTSCARVHQGIADNPGAQVKPLCSHQALGHSKSGCLLTVLQESSAYTRCARSDAASICSHKRALDISPCLCDTVFKSFSHVQSRSRQIRGKHFFFQSPIFSTFGGRLRDEQSATRAT